MRDHVRGGARACGAAAKGVRRAVLATALASPLWAYVSSDWSEPLQAGMVTLLVFGGLTAGVFVSGKDFSFMGPVLWVGSMLALGLVVAAVLFGFNLGLVFSVAMVGLAAGYIIYDTSNVMHRYGPTEHVGASLALFASVALMFYYVLRIFMATRDD